MSSLPTNSYTQARTHLEALIKLPLLALALLLHVLVLRDLAHVLAKAHRNTVADKVCEALVCVCVREEKSEKRDEQKRRRRGMVVEAVVQVVVVVEEA